MIKSIDFWISDEESLICLQLDVERYLGTRACEFLDLQNEEALVDLGAPKAEDYDVGCYGHSTQGSIDFIKARLSWAKDFFTKRLKEGTESTDKPYFSLY